MTCMCRTSKRLPFFSLLKLLYIILCPNVYMTISDIQPKGLDFCLRMANLNFNEGKKHMEDFLKNLRKLFYF